MARQSPKQNREDRAKVEKVMHEYKEGELHSSSGALVTDRDQAIAIALSEARRRRRRRKKHR